MAMRGATVKKEPTSGGTTAARQKARPRKRKTLEELTPQARETIFAAAAKVVGKYGYANATMKRIAKAAGIAEGTIYLYFESRQSLFDQLLPHEGAAMIKYVRDRIAGAKDIYEVEEMGFRAFFEFMKENAGFFRILSEAESAAPIAHRIHFDRLADGYRRALRRGVAQGDIRKFDQEELEAVAYIFMAARTYLHLKYFRDVKAHNGIPEKAVQAYMKIVRHGLR